MTPPGVRLLLAATVAGVTACGSSEPVTGPLASQKLTVVVAVVDSLMPHEVGAATPMLAELKAAGTFYEESRAVFIAETTPNHVAMMTGVYPERNGIYSNDFLDFSVSPPAERRLSQPEKLTANTLFTWIDRRCRDTRRNPEIRTAATLSKTYLYEVFAGDAADPAVDNDDPDVFNVRPDSYWNPQDDPAYIGEPDEHTPDAPTMDQALLQLRNDRPDFFFINLGDVDRLAHASGEDARAAALASADAQLRRLVDELRALDLWDRTVLFVVSDHGMDYSPAGPATTISTQAALDQLGACTLPMKAIVSGEGTESIYVLDRAAPLESRQAALRSARACLLTQDCATWCPGSYTPVNWGNIATAWYREFDALDPAGNMPPSVRSAHPQSGDLVLGAGPGGKFGEPSAADPRGQIPGNHGHLVTLRNTFLVSGGSPWVKRNQVIAASGPNGYLDRLPEQAESVDVAPTVAWLLGLDIGVGTFPDFAEVQRGFDGRILKEAFVQFDTLPDAAAPTRCGRFD